MPKKQKLSFTEKSHKAIELFDNNEEFVKFLLISMCAPMIKGEDREIAYELSRDENTKYQVKAFILETVD